MCLLPFAVHLGAYTQVLHGAAHPTLNVRHLLDIPATAGEADAAYVNLENFFNRIDWWPPSVLGCANFSPRDLVNYG